MIACRLSFINFNDLQKNKIKIRGITRQTAVPFNNNNNSS